MLMPAIFTALRRCCSALHDGASKNKVIGIRQQINVDVSKVTADIQAGNAKH